MVIDTSGATSAREQHVEPDPAAVAGARRFAGRVCADLGADPEASDTVEMLVSELITNVVLHARTPALVRISDGGELLRVAVVDGSPAMPRQRRRFGLMESTGRGLRLLEGLSTDHGTRPDDAIAPGGKSVWFAVRKTTTAEDEQARTDAVTALFDAPGGS